MLINSNILAANAARLLSASANRLGKSLGRLSSGSKIVSPEDDSAGLSEAAKIHNESLRNTAAGENLQNAISLLQTKDGYLQKVQKAFDRMSELAILAQDATKTDVDRQNYNSEFQALTNFIGDVRTKTFNGVNLFSQFEVITFGASILWSTAKTDAESRGGNLATITSSAEMNTIASQLENVSSDLWIGATDNVTEGTFQWVTGESSSYTNWNTGQPDNSGDEDYVQLVASAGFKWNDYPDNGYGLVSGYLLEKSSSISVTSSGNGSSFRITTDWLPEVAASVDTAANAWTALSSVRDAIEALSKRRAETGASLRRVQSHFEEMQIMNENLNATISLLTDVDVADESTEFARSSILVQSGTAMLAQANALPQSVLRLIG